MPKCEVSGCRSGRKYECDQDYQFFPIPWSKKELRQKWLENIDRLSIKDKDQKCFVCAKHFTKNSFVPLTKTLKNGKIRNYLTLKPDAIPILYLKSARKLNRRFETQRSKSLANAEWTNDLVTKYCYKNLAVVSILDINPHQKEVLHILPNGQEQKTTIPSRFRGGYRPKLSDFGLEEPDFLAAPPIASSPIQTSAVFIPNNVKEEVAVKQEVEDDPLAVGLDDANLVKVKTEIKSESSIAKVKTYVKGKSRIDNDKEEEFSNVIKAEPSESIDIKEEIEILDIKEELLPEPLIITID